MQAANQGVRFVQGHLESIPDWAARDQKKYLKETPAAILGSWRGWRGAKRIILDKAAGVTRLD